MCVQKQYTLFRINCYFCHSITIEIIKYMAFNYLDRYYWLVELVRSHDGMTLEEIQNAWDSCYINDDHKPLARRTFIKQRNSIESMLHIHIMYKPGKGYIIEDDDYNIDRVIDMVLSSNSLIKFAKHPGMAGRIQIQPESDGLNHINTIVEAMKLSRCIDLKFKQFYETEYRDLTIEPYGLKQFDRRWYLVGPEIGDRPVRAYCLDKIKEPQMSKNTFVIPDDFSLNAFYNDYFGTVMYESDDSDTIVPPTDILLKVWKRERPYIESLKLHHTQEPIEEHEEYSIYHCYMAPTWDVERRLLECNDHVEVLAPQELRDMMAEHAQNMVDLYNGRWD